MTLRGRIYALAGLAALSICLTGCDEIIGGIIYLVYFGFSMAVAVASLVGLVMALLAATKRQRAIVTFVLSIPFAAIGVGTHLWLTNGFAPAKDSIEQAYLPIVLAMGMPILWLVAGFVAFMFSPPAPELVMMDPSTNGESAFAAPSITSVSAGPPRR